MRHYLLLLALMCALTGTMVSQSGGPFVAGYTGGPVLSTRDVVSAELSNGNLVVVGTMPGANAWIQPTGYQKQHGGLNDCFVAIVDKTLTKVHAFTYLGGGGDDFGTAVVVQSDGTIVVAGSTESEDMPTSVGSVGAVLSQDRDGFVVGFSPDLKTVRYGTYINGSGSDEILDMCLDGQDNIYLTGSTTSRYGFPLVSPLQNEHVSGKDGYVLMLSRNVTRTIFGTYYGSDGDDAFRTIATDSEGTIYVGGSTTSASFPTYPAITTPYWWQQADRPYDWTHGGGLSEGVFLSFAPNGARTIVATYIGGDGDDDVMDVIPMSREVYIVGITSSTDLEMSGGLQDDLRGARDGFIVGLDLTGRTRLSSSYFGGTGDDTMVGGLKLNATDILVWGTSRSMDFKSVGYRTRSTIRGAEDGYFAILNSGKLVQASTFGGDRLDYMTDVLTTHDGGIVLLGVTNSSQLLLDNGETLVTDGSSENWSAFIAKFQRGGIDVSDVTGTVYQCASEPLRVRWSATEMMNGDTYTVDISTDGEEWIQVAEPTTQTQVAITTIATDLYDRPLHIRIRSSRGHVTYMDGRVVLVPEMMVQDQLPSKASMCRGDAITVRYNVAGTAAQYAWFINDAEVPGQTADSLVIQGLSNGTRIKAVATSQCKALLVSDVLTLTVSDQPSISTTSPDQDLLVGQTLDLTITSNDVGASTYQWYRNGQPVPGATSRSLRIPNIQFNHAGLYTCTMVNPCGSTTSREIRVDISPATSVLEGVSQDTEGTLTVRQDGSMLFITCETLHGGASIGLYDLEGRQVGSRLLSTAGLHEIQMSVPGSGGVYFIAVTEPGAPTRSVSLLLH